MTDKRYDYLIIGAGFAGLSTAYFLAKEKAGSILVLEKENAPGLCASGKNASMICQLVRDPVLEQLMIRSSELIRKEWLNQFPEVTYHACGSHHIGFHDDLSLFDQNVQLARNAGILINQLSRKETIAQCSILSQTDFDSSLYCPSDGIIYTQALLHHLADYCKNHNASILTNSCITRIEKHGNGFNCYLSDNRSFYTQYLINAAGAWANQLVPEGHTQPTIRPTRRHIYISHELPELANSLPIVWDVSREIYFRPFSQNHEEKKQFNQLLLSPCDEETHPAGPTTVDPHVHLLLSSKLKEFLPHLELKTYQKIWSGLRTFSDDRRYTLGWDNQIDNYFWVSCLGGYGVTASAGIGEMAAHLILNKKVSPQLQEALSPHRFQSALKI